MYGQTGSGKTYTLVKDFEDNNLKGIIPRTFEYLFNRIKFIENEEQNLKMDINIAYIQIYLETIQDLFCPKTIVKIREDSKKGLFLDGCLWIPVKNEEECKEAFQRGEKNRITEYNKINEHTLRSHTILLINIEQHQENKDIEQNIVSKGILYLVNLAGSERVGKYYKNSNKIEQAKKINNSLSVLGNCIQNLVSGKNYIPYRESKLTRILQESLNGNSKTSLIITISPSNINSEETYSSLNFGTRALKVKIHPQKNITNNEQNRLKILSQKYNELYNKYKELSLKYEKDNELEDEESKIKNKIIEENITEIKKKNSLLNEKEEIIDNLKNQLDEVSNKYKICSLENDKLNKEITSLNNLNKANKIEFEKETKEFLEKQNFEVEEITNHKINYILKQLIKDINQKDILINNLKNQTDLLNILFHEIKIFFHFMEVTTFNSII